MTPLFQHVTSDGWSARVRTGFVATIVGAVSLMLTLPAEARGPEDLEELAPRLLESVVNISTSQLVDGGESVPMPEVPEGSPFEDFFREFFERNQQNDQPRRVSSLGSGFVIDEDGIIVTNNHVIAEADEIEVTFTDGTTLVAELLGTDPKTDIAVLQVDSPEPLTAVPFGSSENLRVGQWVLAIGNPFGLGGSVTAGIVSAMNRDINAGPYDSFIQTDAAINRGNSGGPLFNLDGEVVGINTAIISPSGGSIGLGFAIPTELAIGVIDQLREFGETRRGWLGVTIQDVTDDIAESLDLAEAAGALVAGVRPDSPAGEAGLEPGDVIVEFDGQAIGDTRDLSRTVADTPVGRTVGVVLYRVGERMTLDVTIARLVENEEQQPVAETETPDADTVEIGPLGVTVAPQTEALRDEYSITHDVEGVVIVAVDEGGPAASRQVSAGDLIAEVAQNEIGNASDLTDAIASLIDRGRDSALFLIVSPGGDHRFVVMPVDQ
ncbi:MAG: Do family serine endopeptidase [Pseudomonadota bacterium]